MHAFFDSYVNCRSTLKTFAEQYEVAVNDKIRKETEADFQSKSWKSRLTSKYTWEGQFASAYTLNVYKIFVEEINKICNCNVKEVACIGEDDDAIGVERYEVLEMLIGCNEYHKQYTYIVDYRPSGEYISCNCRKFECKDILCVHVLKVLVYKDVQHVNERYILRRWRKDVHRLHSSIVFTGGYPHMTAEYKEIQEMEQDFQQCVDLVGGSEEKMKFLKKRGKETKNALMNWRNPVPEVPSGLVEEGISPEILIGDPKVSRPRGRPKQKRFKSVVEKNRSRGNSNIGT
ncbi:hypothetical protein AAHA92_32595 [Salvia divinorum]|uniref:Protein FAR1-RELATED SEQUENCE n=1 Tax=Salvia divinorum TaxID=28513 RepID=A0ABD1FPG7_SALDI